MGKKISIKALKKAIKHAEKGMSKKEREHSSVEFWFNDKEVFVDSMGAFSVLGIMTIELKKRHKKDGEG